MATPEAPDGITGQRTRSIGGYSRILRGPMGGDHYTQIHNGVFRDTTLTPNEKAIFGWMSTQKQGWETGLAGIAKGVGIGVATARRAVAGLKRRHFLAYGQDRNPDGTKGQGWYFLTDLPAQLAELGITDPDLVGKAVDEALATWMKENPRSRPRCQNRESGDADTFPLVGTEVTKTGYPVQPHAVPNPPKKTKEPQENQDKEERSKTHFAKQSAAAERGAATQGVAGQSLTSKPDQAKSKTRKIKTGPGEGRQRIISRARGALPYFNPEVNDPMEYVAWVVDGFTGCEETMAQNMIDRGAHPYAVVNKIYADEAAGMGYA